jgi:uncharacterized membrane protein YbhN (UPF0104 family)
VNAREAEVIFRRATAAIALTSVAAGGAPKKDLASTSRPPLRVRRLLVQVTLGTLVGAALVAVGLSQVSVAEVARTLEAAGPWHVAAAAAAAACVILARAWRYNALLFPMGARSRTRRRASAASMVTVALASWGPGLILPTPTADATFIWLAKVRLGVSIDRSATAVVLARLLDLSSLLLVGLLTAPLAGVKLPLIAQLGAGLAMAAILAVLAGLLWAPSRGRLGRLLGRVPRAGRYVERLDAALAELAHGRSLVQLILSTAAARLFTAFQYLALFAAVGLPLGFWQAWFALSVRTLLLAIPVQGPAGLGTTQLWWVTALLLLGTSAHTAIVAGLSVHLLDLVVSLSLAALGWVLLALPRPHWRPD